ncbi:unnamed protein product [Cyprideis torosa]|uniref:GDP-fucose transporter 1 n=1 Tax=Cyprideis torosa TaxID=163714 RepID=A0A7R8ZQC2_9CRUS|nr:unnamed protein product [Cyprideis torosa]CAG0890343.1 unnamed protein product [Cyprideis torosa]
MTTESLQVAYLRVAGVVALYCLSAFVAGQKTSRDALISCAVIISGFWLGVNEESSEGKSGTVLGVVFGILASAFVALNAIYTKKVLPLVNGSVLQLTFLNNVNACFIFLLPIYFSNEYHVLQEFSKLYDLTFWIMISMSGFFGFAIGYVQAWQVQITSPVTANVSGTAKAAAQTVLACLWYSELKSTLWWLSNMIVLLGSAMYTRVKQLEMKAAHVEKAENISEVKVDGVKDLEASRSSAPYNNRHYKPLKENS